MHIPFPRLRCLPFRLAALLLLAVPVAHAQPPPSVFLEDLTWPELKAQIAAGHTTILVPVGGTEQNGPAMALGKHNARARALAGRIARALGNALVAPVIAYVPEGAVDPPTGHMRFPGTITVPVRTFEETVASAARSFKAHGFRDVVLLGDHGGYRKALAAVAGRLDREWAATPVRVHVIGDYYRAATTDYALALEARGFSKREIGTHAGLADVALTLAVDAGQVRTDRLADPAARDPAHGVHGDPRRATAALGQIGVELIVTRTVQAIRRAVERR